MTAAGALGDMGHEVHLVERGAKLGGHVARARPDHQGQRPRRRWSAARAAPRRQPQRQDPPARPSSSTSTASSATSRASSPRSDGKRTAGRPRRRHRRHRRAQRTVPSCTASARARRSSPASTSSACSRTTTRRSPRSSAVGFILCAGSLDESHPYCSRTCCQQSIKNAIALKEQDPERPVYVWFKEVRTFGLLEEYYTRARELGVIFTRYDNDTKPPEVHAPTASVQPVEAYRDPYLRRDIELPLDLLVLATPTMRHRRRQRAQQDAQGAAPGRRLLPRGARQAASRGLRLRGHLPLRRRPLPQEHRGDDQPGLRRRRSGRRHPGQAGHSRPAAWSPRSTRRSAPPASPACASAPTRCRSSISVAKKAEIEAAACQGCGVCVSECPVKAITLHHYTDAQIFAKEEALFDGGELTWPTADVKPPRPTRPRPTPRPPQAEEAGRPELRARDHRLRLSLLRLCGRRPGRQHAPAVPDEHPHDQAALHRQARGHPPAQGASRPAPTASTPPAASRASATTSRATCGRASA